MPANALDDARKAMTQFAAVGALNVAAKGITNCTSDTDARLEHAMRLWLRAGEATLSASDAARIVRRSRNPSRLRRALRWFWNEWVR